MRNLRPTASRVRGTEPEPVKRLTLTLPESLHTRFRTACSATNRKMIAEIREFVAHRTEELEKEAGLSASEWAMLVSRRPRPVGPVERRLRALDRASECNHPTADIDKMLADIERGRDIR